MNKTIALEQTHIVPTYVRPEIVFTHGEGPYLFAEDGKRYLDFTSGIAVTSLGHSHPEWVAAVQEQAAKLVHVSNLYHTEPHVGVAKRLADHSFGDRVFFCNSGTEATEGALKFARKYAKQSGNADKVNLIGFSAGFHGRTIGALAVTYKEKYRAPFAPVMPGATFGTFNDIDALEDLIDENTAAVIVEPMQGEGGVNPADREFLQGLRALCDKHGALLIFDEVQVGLGRTGKLWGHEHAGVAPDIMTLAKPLANGLPIGAIVCSEKVAQVMAPGDHGSTFAAGPLVCRAAEVTFDIINQPEFLAHVTEMGNYLQAELNKIESSHIKEVRGIGLLIGIELDIEVGPLVAAARDHGLLAISAGPNVLRLAPALTITKAHADEALAVLKQILATD